MKETNPENNKTYYVCCPVLNKECDKANCYSNGGNCYLSISKKYECQCDFITNYIKDLEAQSLFFKHMYYENLDTSERLKQIIEEAIEHIQKTRKIAERIANKYSLSIEDDELLKILEQIDEDAICRTDV